MISQTVFLANGPQEYAFGLQWFQAQGIGDIGKQAFALARKANATHYTLRKLRGQYGLANVTDRQMTLRHIAKPWQSAAATLAEAISGTWIAALPLAGNRYYVVAVINGRILTGDSGDVVFSTEDDAKTHVDTLLKHNKFQTVYAPPEWRIQHSKTLDLAATLTKRRGSTLASVRFWSVHFKPWQYAAAGTAAAIFAGTTIYIIAAHHRAAERAALAARHRPVIIRPTITPAGATLARCASTLPLMLYAMAIPGFDNETATCDANTATLTTRVKPNNPISVIRSYAPQAIFTNDHRTADVPFHFHNPLPTAAVAPPFWTLNQYKTALANIAEPAEAQPDTDNHPPSPIPACGCQTYQWTITTAAPPEMWLDPLAQIPNTSVTLASVAMAAGTMTWTIKGTGYVAP
ncbi:MAG: type 4b pilus protein PilO2 [Magnetospirillum sp.]|nr:type 4b pilus protein PilO2 [Magnetospirillum sp.]